MVKKNNAVSLADPVIIVDELVMDGGRFEVAQISSIRISRTNRKRFNEEAMQELAADIKAVGVVQPIVIRPVTPTALHPEIYEIVAGERRYRASIIAGKTTIPVMIHILTDLQAARIQILENLKREDPHEMEEAEGYQNLMLAHGFNADQLAAELNKSRSYVYGRLKLCALAKDLREDFLDRKFPASTALLVARIPVPALQVKAMKEILAKQTDGHSMSVRAAQQHIESRYMLRLVDASFDTKDAKLTDAPSCTKCPKRTGNQPEIFPNIDVNICTDPDCFADKRAASITAEVIKLEKQNTPVFQGEDGNQAMQDARNGNGEYVCVNTWITAFARHKKNSTAMQSAAHALSLDQMGAPGAYVLTANGDFLTLYRKDTVQKALEAAGYCYTMLEAFDRNAPKEVPGDGNQYYTDPRVVSVGGATLSRADHDPYIDRLKQEDAAKAVAEKETTFRVALYKQVRQRGFEALSLDSMRELVKLMLGTFALPDDLMSDVYPFGDEGSDDVVFEYIEQANMQEVQNILMDLVLGEALTVNWRRNDDETLDFATLKNIAKIEGIDPDQLRADLDKPAEPEVDATPFKRPLITLKKKPVDTVEWPFPVPNSENAGAA